jgi:hypothetical protein
MEGSKLIKGNDAGGIRWFLDGEPVHAGTTLEILLELNTRFDESGRVVGFTPLWVPVRLEFEFDTDGRALMFWPSHGSNYAKSEVLDGVRFRWPR